MGFGPGFMKGNPIGYIGFAKPVLMKATYKRYPNGLHRIDKACKAWVTRIESLY